MTVLESYGVLLLAITIEVVATSALKASDSFARLLPSVVTVVGYSVAFYLLSVIVRTLPVGIVYALWSGIGVVFISLVGWIWFRQQLDFAAIVGIALIVAGVAVVNICSKSLWH